MFGFTDAFGSISHDLIPIDLPYYNLPSKIIDYIMNLYRKMEGNVVKQDWETEVIEFLCGISCAICLIVFNPLIQYIKLQSERTEQQQHNLTLDLKEKTCGRISNQL